LNRVKDGVTPVQAKSICLATILYPAKAASSGQMPEPPESQTPDAAQSPLGQLPLDSVTAPNILSKVEPEYSPEALQLKISGTVVVSYNVDRRRIPYEITITKGLGYGLDERATEALSKWRFRPATKNGEPVPAIGLSMAMAFRTN
jgi:TonB family protein